MIILCILYIQNKVKPKGNSLVALHQKYAIEICYTYLLKQTKNKLFKWRNLQDAEEQASGY